MEKKEIAEYNRKFNYIMENSANIDYSWFNPSGRIIWIDDEQRKDNTFYRGFLASDRKGNIYVYQDQNFTIPTTGTTVSINMCRKYDELDYNIFEWFFSYVSVNNLMWKVNRLHKELEQRKFTEFYTV